MLAQARSSSADDLVRTLDLLAETDREFRFTSQPRLLLELLAVRVCQAQAATRQVPAPAPAVEVPRPRPSARPNPQRHETRDACRFAAEAKGC